MFARNTKQRVATNQPLSYREHGNLPELLTDPVSHSRHYFCLLHIYPMVSIPSFHFVLHQLFHAFVCLNHDLLTTKLHAYGFDDSSLTFIPTYLRGNNQCTKVGNSYSSWAEIVSGVPQGSVLVHSFLIFILITCFLVTKTICIMQTTICHSGVVKAMRM